MPDRRAYFDAALFVASIAGERPISGQVRLFLTKTSKQAGYVGYTMIVDSVGDGKQAKAMRARGKQIMKALGRADIQLDEYETQLASEIIAPGQMATAFADIGGLDPIIENLKETIIYPLVYPELFSHSNVLGATPKGVLLYGPPGCGKTMMAKALAKESGATFINIKISNLANKWFGESNKLVAGVFSLARKLEPSIIFIDEIDAFLRTRSSSDHEVTAMMKAEFMTLWDGLLSTTDRIIVLGATNRPEDIDPAIMRRMPKRFRVPLPDFEARVAILKIILAPLNLAPTFSYDALSAHTGGMSGSDLKELCRNAAMVPVREQLSLYQKQGQLDMAGIREKGMNVRPVRNEDFNIESMKNPANGHSILDDIMPGGLD